MALHLDYMQKIILLQDVEGEFQASLTINEVSMEMVDSRWRNTLTVKNCFYSCKTVYSFKLELASTATASATVGGVVVAILIILIIVGVTFYARAKGILCFASGGAERRTSGGDPRNKE